MTQDCKPRSGSLDFRNRATEALELAFNLTREDLRGVNLRRFLLPGDELVAVMEDQYAVRCEQSWSTVPFPWRSPMQAAEVTSVLERAFNSTRADVQHIPAKTLRKLILEGKGLLAIMQDEYWALEEERKDGPSQPDEPPSP